MAKNEAEESVVDSFMKSYEDESQLWRAFTSYAYQVCQGQLRGRVQASVTSRLKTAKSLREKLEKNHKTKPYDKSNPIEADKKLDMVGIRIQTFFPKQVETAYQIVEQCFDFSEKLDGVPNPKDFDPNGWNNKDKLAEYTEQFGHYEARHYYVKIKEESWSDAELEKITETNGNKNEKLTTSQPEIMVRFKNQLFEIQVRSSMLMDAWAEIRHDIIYKGFGYKPSHAERALLDGIKGLVLTGGVLLNHLLELHEERLMSDDTRLNTVELVEQALMRTLPKLSESKLKIGNVQTLQAFLRALSIDTPGEFKRKMGMTQFTEGFNDFQKEQPGQPAWTYILQQIFMTLSEKEVKELIAKIPESHRIHEVFCRSISWLEHHLSQREQTVQFLQPNEIERCKVIWNLHEHISATWPEYKAKLPSILESLFAAIKSSPLPRVDTSLYVAIADLLSGTRYRLPETIILQKLRHPMLVQCAEMWDNRLRNMLCDLFRWHQHDSFIENEKMSEELRKRSETFSANLLKTQNCELRGALLHRAVCHQDKETNAALVKQLLQNVGDTNVNFMNQAGQSTLHVATIFHPRGSMHAVDLLLKTNLVEVNTVDNNGETALLAASFLKCGFIKSHLLEYPSTDKSLKGGMSPEVVALIFWDAVNGSRLEPLCRFFPYHPDRICVFGCCCEFLFSRSVLAESVRDAFY